MFIKRLIFTLLRLFLAVVFLVSGFLKSIDPVGASLKTREYLNLFFSVDFAIEWSFAIAVTLCVVEFVIGSCLLLGIYRRTTVFISFLLLLVFTALTGYNYAFDLIGDCGCFGDAIKLSPFVTFFKNIVLLLMSVVLLNKKAYTPLFFYRERRLLLVLSILAIANFIYVNNRFLPIVDFRPYKLGYDIRERSSEEERAVNTKLQEGVEYIYEKDGEVKAFKQDALPDSTWSFKELKQNVALADLKLSYNFELDSLGESYKDRVLLNKEQTVLVFIPNLAKATYEKIDEINSLYDEVHSREGVDFYLVSSSSEEEQSEWQYKSGAEYPILTMDISLIQTIIRAPIGLLVLDDGVITNKQSLSSFPKLKEVASFTDDLLNNIAINKKNKYYAFVFMAIWLIFVIFGVVRYFIRYFKVSRYLRK